MSTISKNTKLVDIDGLEIDVNSIVLSVVSPVYRAENIVEELVRQLHEQLQQITPDYEIILVNDASPDTSWDKILKVCTEDKRVKGINLSRNFGQHYAISAGLDYTRGSYVIIMDCDLQDNPSQIVRFYNKAKDGYQIVLGRRVSRKDSFLKEQLSIFYYKLLSYLTETKIDPSVGTYRLLSEDVVVEFRKMRENSRYFGAMINWLGFKSTTIDIEHSSRYEGESSYNFKRSFRLALNGIVSFSDKPLRIAVKIGFWMFLLSLSFILYKIFQVLILGEQVIGWSSLIASIFFTSGIIILVLGIVGLYIGRIFEQVKNRPIYIICETKNFKT